MALQSARDRLKLILRAQGSTVSRDDPDLFDKTLDAPTTDTSDTPILTGSVTSLMPASLMRKRRRAPEAGPSSGKALSTESAHKKAATAPISAAPPTDLDGSKPIVPAKVHSSQAAAAGSGGGGSAAVPGFSLFAPAPVAAPEAAAAADKTAVQGAKPTLAAEYDDFMAQLDAL